MSGVPSFFGSLVVFLPTLLSLFPPLSICGVESSSLPYLLHSGGLVFGSSSLLGCIDGGSLVDLLQMVEGLSAHSSV